MREKKINKRDDDGLPIGYWTWISVNESYKGSYEKGEQVGFWQLFHEDNLATNIFFII